MAVGFLLAQASLLLLIVCSGIDASAVASFINEECATGGVNPFDPLLFTCAVNGAILMRVILPTGDQEIISVGDTAADVDLPTGFTAVSLNVTEIDAASRNFSITISIASASLLDGGMIICDNSTPANSEMDGCPIAPLTLSFVNDTPRVSEYSMIADFTANREGVEITCYIPGLGKGMTDCSSGTFSHYFTSDEIWERNTKKYILHVQAFDRNTNEVVTLKGSFRVFGHQEKYFCTQNMINTATKPINTTRGVVEFISVGKAAAFRCKIDGNNIPCGDHVRIVTAFEMKRKIYSLNITNLMPGPHRLFVQPTGGCIFPVCYRDMTYFFTVAD